ncbi:uncharacterized protein LOC122510488 [Leptopilina heterotoma]|uniref:uncharacterized protein LOC122510488 n=1 Tax=Leptopilina heterotoma TaxID=63436 RepID=UPI001CA9F62A|nr:uncharacterized protein LOC122510488 [Leptopilina heterotoma]
MTCDSYATHMRTHLCGPVIARARTRQVIPIDILNTELKEGYLPLIKTTEGLLLGEGIVTNRDGVCHIYAINMTIEDAEIEIPPQELIPFECYKLPDEDITEEDIEIPNPPIQKPSRSLLPSLKLPSAATKNMRGPKSAPPQLLPKIVNFSSPEKTVVTVKPPVSESEKSSEEEENNMMNLSRKEIAQDLRNSITRFNKSLKQHEDWLMDSPQPPRDWIVHSDGNNDETIHKAANELIPGDHSEFSQKFDLYWDYAKGASIWENNEIDNPDSETSINEITKPEQSIHQTPQKNEIDSYVNTYHTSLHETDVDTDDEDEETTDDDNEDEKEGNEEKENTNEEEESEEEENTDNEPKEYNFKSNSMITIPIESIPPNLPSSYSKITEKLSNITSHRENLSYHRNNYVHFLSADCEPKAGSDSNWSDLPSSDPDNLSGHIESVETIKRFKAQESARVNPNDPKDKKRLLQRPTTSLERTGSLKEGLKSKGSKSGIPAKAGTKQKVIDPTLTKKPAAKGGYLGQPSTSQGQQRQKTILKRPSNLEATVPSQPSTSPSLSQPSTSRDKTLDAYTDVYVDGACCEMADPAREPESAFGLVKITLSTSRNDIEASKLTTPQKLKQQQLLLLNKIERFTKVDKTLKPLDVVWKHVPGHEGIPGNENADQLAREGTLKDPEPDSSSSSDQQQQQDESSDQEDQPKDDPITETQHLIQGVNESLINSTPSQAQEQVTLISQTTPYSGIMKGLDHASRRQCVSGTGEDDQEHLDYLRTQDPLMNMTMDFQEE